MKQHIVITNTIYVTCIQEPGKWLTFFIVKTSPTSGSIGIVTNPNQSFSPLHSRNTLQVPAGNVAMISFAHFRNFRQPGSSAGLTLSFRDRNGSEVKVWKQRDHSYTETFVCDVGTVIMQWKETPSHCYETHCFKMLHSFHPKSNVPQKVSSGLFNCSVDYYWRFKQHLECNLRVECQDRRDETGPCSISSPACRLWGKLHYVCYKLVNWESLLSRKTENTDFLNESDRYCSLLNATIGHPKDDHDIQIFKSVLFKIKTERDKKIVLGLSYGGLSVPNMYRESVVATDRTVLHHTLNHYLKKVPLTSRKACLFFHMEDLLPYICPILHRQVRYHGTCRFVLTKGTTYQDENDVLMMSNVSFPIRGRTQDFTKCLNGQVTHTFLARDPHRACKEETMPISLRSPMKQWYDLHGRPDHSTSFNAFLCDDDSTRLSYNLVCDFRQDCPDRSDELFCQHPLCQAFLCTNGECVSYTKRCDRVSDCMDNSDEMVCRQYRVRTVDEPQLFQSPVLIRFDGRNFFVKKNMSSTDICPDTHYRCPGEYNDCLPVYTRCNGWYDCLGHEDEEDCEAMTCPGFYRCFLSTVCAHADHLCDDWPQCPRGDDEWLCGMTCPAQCLCQGHAFVCHKPFPAHLFSQLRYLNARGSGLTLSYLNNHTYLVWLDLSRCSLTVLPAMTTHNLQFLDLSENHLQFANMSMFAHLKSLLTLVLAANPIRKLHSNTASVIQQSAVKTIDLSLSNLTVFDSSAFASYSSAHTLNLSFSPVHTIQTNGFRCLSRLTNLYMEEVPVQTFPADMFKSLFYLRVVTTQTFKLCCRQILPHQFDVISCSAPSDEISSCEDLLRSGIYRVFLWLISCLALLGNLFCLVVRVCVQSRTSTSGFRVFVTNLSMADLLMGVYIAIIGVADELFRGTYLFSDHTWTHSVACKTAGFLCLLSSEASALSIWLITLDRFIVLRFPFTTKRFGTRSATGACLITWLVGWVLALVPLLPVPSHWEFFSQTGICIPLPVTRQDFKGKFYSISVFLILNFVLFLLIAIGQTFIFWSVQKNALKTCATKTSLELTIAKRLISVALTDFMCWFPIGLCGLLALAGIPIPGEVNVALAIFVLPLNSALNPFVYTFNMLMERRRKSKEAALLKWLEQQSDLLET